METKCGFDDGESCSSDVCLGAPGRALGPVASIPAHLSYDGRSRERARYSGLTPVFQYGVDKEGKAKLTSGMSSARSEEKAFHDLAQVLVANGFIGWVGELKRLPLVDVTFRRTGESL